MSIRTGIWNERAWAALTPTAQLYGIVCRSLAKSGPVSDQKVAAITGWPDDMRASARNELEHSPYRRMLTAKRRPMNPTLRKEILERDGHTCQNCGATGGLHVDHIHPVALGGEDVPTNLQVLCRTCNLKKGARIAMVQSR